MNIPSIYEIHLQVQQEAQAELQAVETVGSDSAVGVAKNMHFSESIIVFNLKREEFTITIGQISGEVEKFAKKDTGFTFTQFLDELEPLTATIAHLLINRADSRYNYVRSDEDVAWFNRAISICIRRKIMIRKYEKNKFISPEAAALTACMIANVEAIKLVSRATNHSTHGESEEANQLLQEAVTLLRHNMELQQQIISYKMQKTLLEAPHE